ncbi:MAG: class I SAM-dependent methyltransferase family protein [Candidatus Nanohaloarchaea archaeon]|nr:class I SAM-dependent methyltransferase family protein [Candidatus Nanohaloarchaea archaeon]
MDLKERLADELSDEELSHLVTSYDIVGDVAIIKVPDELEHRKDAIADALLEQHSNVNTVVRKTGERSGDYRVADYEVLRGDSTETLHREHGCRFELDPTTVYFSERLGHERGRVVDQAEPGETVIDMFAGVGPFTVELARNADAGQVHAFEANPAAADYLERNVELNGVADRVDVYGGDVRDHLPGVDVAADRVIMNLPGSSEAFLGLALDTVWEGGVIHYYSFVPKDDLDDGTAAGDVAERFAEHGADVTVERVEVCGHYNPAVERVCFDVRVEAVER